MGLNNRRQFFKGAGLFGTMFAVGGAAIANTAVPKIEPPKAEPVVEDISHLAPPESAASLQITGAYGEKPKPVTTPGIGGSTYTFYPMSNPVVTHQVSMAVGKDNRLWIKVGDEWKRVALEG